MQISSRFTMAIHMFACIVTFKNQKITSEFLANSIGTNPVIIRKLLIQLKKAGLLKVLRGTGGIIISYPLDKITLLDVYKAVECNKDEELFHFHENPSINCPVGRNIHSSLDDKLNRIQKAMEDELNKITFNDVINDLNLCIKNEKVSF